MQKLGKRPEVLRILQLGFKAAHAATVDHTRKNAHDAVARRRGETAEEGLHRLARLHGILSIVAHSIGETFEFAESLRRQPRAECGNETAEQPLSGVGILRIGIARHLELQVDLLSEAP